MALLPNLFYIKRRLRKSARTLLWPDSDSLHLSQSNSRLFIDSVNYRLCLKAAGLSCWCFSFVHGGGFRLCHGALPVFSRGRLRGASQGHCCPPRSAAYATEAASVWLPTLQKVVLIIILILRVEWSGVEGRGEAGGRGASWLPACRRLKSGRVEIPDRTAAVSPCHKVQMTFTQLIKPVLVINGNYMFTYHTYVLLLAQWVFHGGSQSGKKQLPSPCAQFSQPFTSSKDSICVIFSFFTDFANNITNASRG